MQSNAYIDALGRQGQHLLVAARPNLDVAVPTCPGWQVRDVLGHLGRVYRSVSGILDTRSVEPPTATVPKPPPGDAVGEFFADGLDALATSLRNTDVDTPVFTWGTHNVAGFYHRRMAHETAAHSMDVLLATGAEPSYDGDLAADGITELYDEVLRFGLFRRPTPLPDASLRLHRTDGAEQWTIRPGGGTDTTPQPVVYSLCFGAGEADDDPVTVAVHGPAGDLFRYVWNRGRADSLEVIGDVEDADAWARLAP